MIPLPRISVIVAVLNGAQTLKKCIESITSQTYRNKEIIVIDGESIDGSVDILRSYHGNISHLESAPRRGVYYAWNTALNHVSGDWICFLGHDDFFWKVDVLERTAICLDGIPPNIRIAYGQIAYVNSEDKVLRVYGEPWEKASSHLLDYMPVPSQGCMHHRSLFELRGKFDESFKISGDYELLLRELTTNKAFFIPDLIVAGVGISGMSSDPRNYLINLNEDIRARRKNGLPAGTLSFYLRYFRALLRDKASRILGEDRVRYLAILKGRVSRCPSYWRKRSARIS